MRLISFAKLVHFQVELTAKRHAKTHVSLFAFDEREVKSEGPPELSLTGVRLLMALSREGKTD